MMVFTRKDGIFMGYVSFREGNPNENDVKKNNNCQKPRDGSEPFNRSSFEFLMEDSVGWKVHFVRK